METVALVAVLLCILVAAALSRRIQNTMLTLPMVYAVLGLLLSNRFLGIIEISPDSEIVRLVAELTLVLLLATDASRIDLRALAPDRDVQSLVHRLEHPAGGFHPRNYRGLLRHDDGLANRLLRHGLLGSGHFGHRLDPHGRRPGSGRGHQS